MSDGPKDMFFDFENFAFTFVFDRSHPAAVTRHTLRVVCPHHPDQVIVEHRRQADGSNSNRDFGGWRSEFVSDTPMSPETRRSIVESGHSAAVLPVASVQDTERPDDVAHHRYHYECPLPSCNYHAQLRVHRAEDPIDDILNGMANSGLAELTVTHIDRREGPVPVRQ